MSAGRDGMPRCTARRWQVADGCSDIGPVPDARENPEQVRARPPKHAFHPSRCESRSSPSGSVHACDRRASYLTRLCSIRAPPDRPDASACERAGAPSRSRARRPHASIWVDHACACIWTRGRRPARRMQMMMVAGWRAGSRHWEPPSSMASAPAAPCAAHTRAASRPPRHVSPPLRAHRHTRRVGTASAAAASGQRSV